MYNSILHFKRKGPRLGETRKSEAILLNMRINTKNNDINAGFLSYGKFRVFERTSFLDSRSKTNMVKKKLYKGPSQNWAAICIPAEKWKLCEKTYESSAIISCYYKLVCFWDDNFCIVLRPKFWCAGASISVHPSSYAFRYIFFGLYCVFFLNIVMVGENF